MMKKKLLSVLLCMLLVVSFASVGFADSTTYEAEDANLVGATWANENEDGVGFVGGYDNPSSDWVEFTVTVSETGTYEVELSYATPMDNASVAVHVNGGSATVVPTPSTGDWADGGFQTITFDLDLEEGENSVVFKQNTEYVQLDYIKVFGNGETAVDEEASEENEGAAVNPETGDAGVAIYYVIAALALVGFGTLVITKKKVANQA
ncbi:hypothetical protein BKP35_05525 [Anaerobacillus arseniciselenatis]|uniref:CBM6 domain-containing protein n=1 Tax=Anaerobacillus arseniciselenatis TaxID=85682 RepID=A0A1S2LRZ2_9BACI|nr:CBM35 domain-containing protein [Anaerobacillus arseniciselenatis]OIJ14893.1 hypothetical protein BKP35_05525 [Anaerobacillus arseniciselenatis]